MIPVQDFVVGPQPLCKFSVFGEPPKGWLVRYSSDKTSFHGCYGDAQMQLSDKEIVSPQGVVYGLGREPMGTVDGYMYMYQLEHVRFCHR